MGTNLVLNLVLPRLFGPQLYPWLCRAAGLPELVPLDQSTGLSLDRKIF